MRRSGWLRTMTLVGLAACMIGAFVVGVWAIQNEHHCLNGCGPKQTPQADGCCKEPDCSIFNEYAAQEAILQELSGEQAPTTWLPASVKEVAESSADSYVEAMLQKARLDVDKELQKNVDCPSYKPPKRLEVNEDCEIGLKEGNTFKRMTRDDARNDPRIADCQETREAEYDAAEQRQTACQVNQIHLSQFPRIDVFTRDDIKTEGSLRALSRLMSLRTALIRFYMSCFKFADPQVLQKIVDALADPIRQQMPSKPPKPKAKRAAGSGRGRSM